MGWDRVFMFDRIQGNTDGRVTLIKRGTQTRYGWVSFCIGEMEGKNHGHGLPEYLNVLSSFSHVLSGLGSTGEQQPEQGLIAY